jgi:outer membrane protein assembly factor BamB
MGKLPAEPRSKKSSGFFWNIGLFFPLEEDEQLAQSVSAGTTSLLETRENTSRGDERNFDYEQFNKNSSQGNEFSDNETKDFAASFHRRAKAIKRTFALLCAAILATASIAKGDWTHFRFDPAHHGVNPNETILTPANVGGLTVKWRITIRGTNGTNFASASVLDDKVYVVSVYTSKVHALNKDTGQELWSFPSDAIEGADNAAKHQHQARRRLPHQNKTARPPESAALL